MIQWILEDNITNKLLNQGLEPPKTVFLFSSSCVKKDETLKEHFL